MSKENVDPFYEKVAKDENLRKEMNNLYVHHHEELQKGIIKLGAESDFVFDEKDMEQLSEETIAAMQENGELDDAQLEAVSEGCGDMEKFYRLIQQIEQIKENQHRIAEAHR